VLLGTPALLNLVFIGRACKPPSTAEVDIIMAAIATPEIFPTTVTICTEMQKSMYQN
jgi:hypothetical protein